MRVCPCRVLKLLRLVCLCLLLSLDGPREAVSLSVVEAEVVAVAGGRERNDGGDVSAEDDEAGQSRLRWEMPRAIVTDSLDPHADAAVVPLCPLLEGSSRAWLLRQYADGHSEQHERSAAVAMQAVYCTTHYDQHKHKTTSEGVCVCPLLFTHTFMHRYE